MHVRERGGGGEGDGGKRERGKGEGRERESSRRVSCSKESGFISRCVCVAGSPRHP